MYGGSSRKVILRWNFSGTPWGGVWLLPGHTISFISRPSFTHDFHTPIYKQRAFKYVTDMGKYINTTTSGKQRRLYTICI
jgi:hypothetical protein